MTVASRRRNRRGTIVRRRIGGALGRLLDRAATNFDPPWVLR